MIAKGLDGKDTSTRIPHVFLTGIPRQHGRLTSGGDDGYQVPATVQGKAGERGNGKGR